MRPCHLALAFPLVWTLACAGVFPPTPEAGTYEVTVRDIERSGSCAEAPFGVAVREETSFELDVAVDGAELTIDAATSEYASIVLETELDLACTQEGEVFVCGQEEESGSEAEEMFGVVQRAVHLLEVEWTSETTFEGGYALTFDCADGSTCESMDAAPCEVTEDWTAALD